MVICRQSCGVGLDPVDLARVESASSPLDVSSSVSVALVERV